MEASRFRIVDGYTQVLRRKTWHMAMNFTLTIQRMVTGGCDQGGPIVKLESPLIPSRSFEGYIPETAIDTKTTMKDSLKRAMPEAGGLVINLSPSELATYWAEKFAKFARTYRTEFGYDESMLPCGEGLGYQPGKDVFMLNATLQLTCSGRHLEPESHRVAFLPKQFKDIPVPTTTQLRPEAARELFRHLQSHLPNNTYMICLMVAGAAVQALHYHTVRELFHQVPIPVIVGQPNTGKSFLAKVAAALLGGLHRNAVYSNLSLPKLSDLLGKALFFVFNDPDVTDRKTRKCLSTLIAKAYEDGKDGNLLREVTPNTVPLITANAPVLKALQGHSMRETSRLVILPQTCPAPPDMTQGVDPLLDRAGESIGCLVQLKEKIQDSKQDIDDIAGSLMEVLPESNVAGRIAVNYAILVRLTQLFTQCCGIEVEEESIYNFAVEVLIPQGVEAHQVPRLDNDDTSLVALLENGQNLLKPEELYSLIRPVTSKGSCFLAVRLAAMVSELNQRQTQTDFKTNSLKKEVEACGGKRSDSTRFKQGVKSAYLVPKDAVPEPLWKTIAEDCENHGIQTKRGRPKICTQSSRSSSGYSSQSGLTPQATNSATPEPHYEGERDVEDFCGGVSEIALEDRNGADIQRAQEKELAIVLATLGEKVVARKEVPTGVSDIFSEVSCDSVGVSCDSVGTATSTPLLNAKRRGRLGRGLNVSKVSTVIPTSADFQQTMDKMQKKLQKKK